MTAMLSSDATSQIFTEARTHRVFLDKPVSDELLHQVFELAKWGPTSMNCLPGRFVFIKSDAERAKLMPALAGGNPQNVQSSPVTVIVAYDEKFYEELPTLFPAFDAKSMFVGNTALIEQTGLRNSSLQGAYLMIAARALGLDCGPMSGFNNALVDDTFFKGTSWKSNFICNLGYGDATKLFPRGPRLPFEQVAKIV